MHNIGLFLYVKLATLVQSLSIRQDPLKLLDWRMNITIIWILIVF